MIQDLVQEHWVIGSLATDPLISSKSLIFFHFSTLLKQKGSPYKCNKEML
jgi:hypothetical protein